LGRPGHGLPAPGLLGLIARTAFGDRVRSTFYCIIKVWCLNFETWQNLRGQFALASSTPNSRKLVPRDLRPCRLVITLCVDMHQDRSAIFTQLSTTCIFSGPAHLHSVTVHSWSMHIAYRHELQWLYTSMVSILKRGPYFCPSLRNRHWSVQKTV